MYTALYNARL